MTEAFYTAYELADYLRVEYQTIAAMVKRGELPCVRFGGQRKTMRFPVKMIEDWVKRQADYTVKEELQGK